MRPTIGVRSLGVARVVWVTTGFLWAVDGLLLLSDVAYWDPVTTLDHVAVWTYSLAWLFLAASIILLGRLVASRPVALIAAVIAVGAAAAGSPTGSRTDSG